MDLDISSMTNLYTDYIKQTATNSSSSIDTSKDYSNASDDELMDVCKQFESYFLEQCLKEMWKTTGSDDEEESGSMSTMVDYYKDNMIQELASESTENNSLGLAQMLYEQMKRNYE